MNTKRNNLPDEESHNKNHAPQPKRNHLKVVKSPTVHNQTVESENRHNAQQQAPRAKRTVLTLLVLLLAACSNTRNNIDQTQSPTKTQSNGQIAQPLLAQVSTAIRSKACHIDEERLQRALLSLVNDARAQAQRLSLIHI